MLQANSSPSDIPPLKGQDQFALTHLLIVVVIPNVYASTDDNPTKSSDEHSKHYLVVPETGTMMDKITPLISKEMKSVINLSKTHTIRTL
jgi:hypothetical protein